MKRTATYFLIWASCITVCAAAGVVTLNSKKSPVSKRTVQPTTLPAGNAALSNAVLSANASATDLRIAALSDKAQHDGKNARIWSDLGDALMQKARETADAGYYTRAEAAYRQALTLDPKDAPAVLGMAWVNGGRHEFEKSIDWANQALKLDPHNNDAYGLIGDADIEMGDYDAAYTHYQKMLDLRPDLSSYGRGAHLLWLTGNTQRAVLLMAQAIKTGGPYAENTAWCRAQLGLMLLNLGALPAADNTLAAALKLTPHNYQVLAALAKVKAARQDYPAAIDLYRRSIAIVPTHDALVALGDLYTLTGNPKEAEKQYALVETIHQIQKSNGVRGDMQIARFYADHDRNLPEALREIETEYTTRKNVYVADTLAWCLYKNGRCSEAAEMSRKALSRRTPESTFRFHAGMIAAKQGDRVSAQQALYQALSLNPHFSPIDAPTAVRTLTELGSRPPMPSIAKK